MPKASEYVSYVCGDVVTNTLKDIEGILDHSTLSNQRKCFEIFRECFVFAKHVCKSYLEYKKKYN